MFRDMRRKKLRNRVLYLAIAAIVLVFGLWINFYENKKVEPTNDKIQLSMDFEEVKKDSEIENKVKEIDPLNMTPIDAINFLYELKEISKKSV